MAEARPDPAVAPPDLVSGTEDLSIKDTEEDVDSTKDLDVVSGGGTPSMSPPEMLDTPPEMLDTPPEIPGTPPDMVEAPPSPDIDLPDAPDSEPGSPKVIFKLGSSVADPVLAKFGSRALHPEH